MTPVPETASWLHRILALVIDWLACLGVTVLVLGPEGWSSNQFSSLYTLLLYVLENTLFTALVGGSFGQLATRLRVVRLDGGRLNPVKALLRSAMIALVIPPLVFRPDGRGLHDMAVGSHVVPLRSI